MNDLTGPVRDVERITQRAGVPDDVATYAGLIVDRLTQNDYQIPADGRTYGAAVYVACRDEGFPLSADEVAEASGLSETAINREYKRIVDRLGISPERVSPSRCLDRYLSEFDVPERVEEEAVSLLDLGREHGLWMNRTGYVSAATALYTAAYREDYDLTQADFEKVGVGATTVRKAYPSLLSLCEDEDEDDRTSGKIVPGDETAVEDRLVEAVEEIHAQVDVPDLVLGEATEVIGNLLDEDSPDGEGTGPCPAWVYGKSPGPIAAGIYWIAASRNRFDVSQSEVADAASVHKVTVNRRVSSVRESIEA